MIWSIRSVMQTMEVSESLISKIYNTIAADVHFAAPLASLSTNEVELVWLALSSHRLFIMFRFNKFT